MAPDPSARDETACNSDDSAADGIEGNRTREHERQDDGGSAALPVALGALGQTNERHPSANGLSAALARFGHYAD
jgi:hypothetical protein